jgi:hypothetical protein
LVRVDGLQHPAPAVTRVVGIRRRRLPFAECRAFLFEADAHLTLECLQSGSVQDFHRRKFQIVTETVVVFVHPLQQEAGSLGAIFISRLPRRDPAAEKAAGECSELAIRVVDLLCLRVAGGEESLIQRDGPRGLGCRQFGNLSFTVTKVRNKGETFVPGKEASSLEGGFNYAVHRVAALSPGHSLYAPVDGSYPY